MNLFEAVALGIVQGLTEFLPISSSAHLVLVPELLGWSNPSLNYIVIVHAATLLSLLIYFRKELTGFLRPKGEGKTPLRLAFLLAIGTAPAAIIGVVFEKQFERQFGKPFQVAIQLMATGLILIGAEILAKRGRDDKARTIPSVPGAIAIGFGQALSIVPGISRSGSTIAVGLVARLSREHAAQFSFLLAIPILIGTTIAKIPDVTSSGIGAQAAIGGFASAFLSGYIAIAGMIGYLKKKGLAPFAIYCLVSGLISAIVLK